MPAFFLLLLSICAIATASATEPLSNKEIALMLRSGSSSESVLGEISSRRTLEPLDPATKKTLLEFGASAQLIAVLESNAYTVSTPEAEQAKRRATDLAARQAAYVEQNRAAGPTKPAQASATGVRQGPAGASLMRGLRDKLVVCRDDTIRRADDAGLENKKLIVLYFSAHWCAPCRKFTPQLVDYYNQVAPQHPDFEVIFVSCDRSRFNWETYMREARMPWPAIDYDQLTGLGGLRQLGGHGIPSLVLLDGTGDLLSSSHDGDRYFGPQKVLADLQKIFAGGANPPLAQVR
jgi:thiol-disulfide isomerase/thioredoxin